MSRRVTLLAAVLFALAALAGAATLPAVPAAPPVPAVAALQAPVASPAWLRPAPNFSVEKPSVSLKPGEAPLGAIFRNACSQSCLQTEFSCFDGCGGDHACNVSCNDDYYCCLQTCNPRGPQCF